MKRVAVLVIIVFLFVGCEKVPEYQKYADHLGFTDPPDVFILADIDLDGRHEIIIAFGSYDLDTYVLQDDGRTIQTIGQLEQYGYNTLNIELVKFQGDEKQYIKAELTNTVNLTGFALYEVAQNNLQKIAYSASATGAGYDYLVDIDNDGYHEGYVQERYSYDVLYCQVQRFFTWDGQDFIPDRTEIDLHRYPDEPEKVVYDFLILSILNKEEENCDMLVQRLCELNVSNQEFNYADYKNWREALHLLLIDFNVNEYGTSAKVRADYENDSINFDLTYNLGRWQITDIN